LGGVTWRYEIGTDRIIADHRAFEGCHVTRDIPTLIEEGEFRVEQMETGYLARFPKSGSYYFWGVACIEPK